jgi:hypothetical protein
VSFRRAWLLVMTAGIVFCMASVVGALIVAAGAPAAVGPMVAVAIAAAIIVRPFLHS